MRQKACLENKQSIAALKSVQILKRTCLIPQSVTFWCTVSMSALRAFGVEELGFMFAPQARRVPAPGWWSWLWVWGRAAGPWVPNKAARERPRGLRSSSCKGYAVEELSDTLRGTGGQPGSSRDMRR